VPTVRRLFYFAQVFNEALNTPGVLPNVHDPRRNRRLRRISSLPRGRVVAMPRGGDGALVGVRLPGASRTARGPREGAYRRSARTVGKDGGRRLSSRSSVDSGLEARSFSWKRGITQCPGLGPDLITSRL
jgi:hypothetical protein